MADLTLSNLSAYLGPYIRSNRGGAKTSEQGNNLPGIQRVGLFRSNAGDTAYVYYNPVSHVLIWADSTPVDAGATG